jgi:DNA-binding GntR family transcriptional regulator
MLRHGCAGRTRGTIWEYRGVDPAQTRDRLLAEILDGDPDLRPSFDEYATMRRLGVRRSTLRSALASLTEAGLLTREPRTGTTLASDLVHWTVEQSSPDVPSRRLRYETVGIDRVVPHEALSVELTGAAGAPVTRIERVSLVDGRAAEYWTIWTVLDLGDEVLRGGLPDEVNWYRFVGAHTGETELRMTRRVIDCRATEVDEAQLDVRRGDPLRFASRMLRFADGTPVDRAWGRINAQLIVPSETFTIRL